MLKDVCQKSALGVGWVGGGAVVGYIPSFRTGVTLTPALSLCKPGFSHTSGAPVISRADRAFFQWYSCGIIPTSEVPDTLVISWFTIKGEKEDSMTTLEAERKYCLKQSTVLHVFS